MKEEMQLESVDFVFTYTKPSGEVVIKGRDNGGNWEQFGGTKEELSHNVALISDLSEVISQYLPSHE